MADLDSVFRVSVVNGLGRLLNGATVIVYRDGVPKMQGSIDGEPLLFQLSGPGPIECEASYNGVHKRVPVTPNDAHVRIKITRWLTFPKMAGAALAAALLVALLLLNRGVGAPWSMEITSEYAGDGPHNKPVAVVFVHGIFGDKSTWGAQKTSFPQLLISDPEFAGKVDAFLFEYYSPHFGPASNVAELAKSLKAKLEDKGVLRDHQRIVFLCHSMGGLVTRRALILARDVSKVAMIYFYATPSNGAEIAGLAGKISSSPQLKSMLPLEGNEALQQIQDDWVNWPAARDLPSYCAYETLPTDGVRVVTQSSARALCNRLPEGMTADHIQIVKPTSRDDPRYTRFATALRETAFSSAPRGTDRGTGEGKVDRFEVRAFASGRREHAELSNGPFERRSSSVNVGCEETREAQVSYELGEGETVLSHAAQWVSMDNIKSSGADSIVTGGSVKAKGSITGLDKQVFNCPGGGHGTLVLSGRVARRSVRSEEGVVEIGTSELSNSRISFAAPSDSTFRVEGYRVDLRPLGSNESFASIGVAATAGTESSVERSYFGVQFKITVQGGTVAITPYRQMGQVDSK